MKKCVLGLLCLFVCFQSVGQTLESDRLALVAIYNGMESAFWFQKTNWSVPGTVGDSPCGWYGVTCEGGRVTGLDLSNNNLGGTIPAAIGNLSALKSLNFSFSTDFELPAQRVTGNIPTEIGNLTNLEYLNLAGVMCDGTIPASIGNLTHLKTLDLHFVPIDAGFDPYGFLSGSIPVEIGNLTNLQYLDLSAHNLTGSLPVQLGNLVNLEYLYLGYNDFTSTLPSSLGNLIKLKHFYLNYSGWLRSNRYGRVSGTIPSTFNNLIALQILDLSSQSLFGPIPNLLGIPATASVSIVENRFNFTGMETNISRLDQYAGQADIPMYVNGELSNFGSAPPNATLSVNAGGTLANNTYRWYRDNMLVATNVGNPNFLATNLGVYYVTVSNSQLPLLTLKSINFSITSLPVTLISFGGKHEGGQNKLIWKTTSETNNKGFEIERSADALRFVNIGFVDGNGDTEEDKTYHFTDLDPFATTYYRLKQLDYDGKFEYSKVIAVGGEGAVVKVFPNPAQDYLTISGITEKLPLSIVDQNGRVVIGGVVSDTQQINIRHLRTGRYVVRVGGESSRLLIHR